MIIDLPNDLDGKMVVVEIREQELDENRVRKFSEMSVEERLEVLKAFQGTAKYPDADVSKYDVYEQ